MIEIFKKLAGAARPATSAELTDALALIDEGALTAAFESAKSARSDALLSGDEKKLERAEIDLSKACRDLDRGRAGIEALTAKIAEAEERETREAIEAERAELEELASSTASDFRRTYEKAAAEIVAALGRLGAAEERISDFNRRAVHSDMGAFLEGVEERAYPTHHGVLSALRLTSLRPVGRAPGYGDGQTVFEITGETRT